MTKVSYKTKEEIKIMKEGGALLGKIRDSLAKSIASGVSAADIEKKAVELVKKAHGEPSFKMVPGYSWATCVNVNDGVVHGIPKKEVVFKKGDVVSVDVGMFFKGFHTDTSVSVYLGEDKSIKKFLEAGRLAIKAAIEAVRVGGHVYDVSEALESVIRDASYYPIKSLTGHGIGRALHEDPYVPCVARGAREKSLELSEGLVLAIEVMYSQGTEDVYVDSDGWTIRTKDGTISALFEETVALTAGGPLVLTN